MEYGIRRQKRDSQYAFFSTSTKLQSSVGSTVEDKSCVQRILRMEFRVSPRICLAILSENTVKLCFRAQHL